MKRIVIRKPNRIAGQILLNTILLFPILGENLLGTLLGDSMSKALSILTCLAIVMVFVKRKFRFCDFLLCVLLLVGLHCFITFVFASSTTRITIANNMITPYGLIGYFMLLAYIDTYIGDTEKVIIIFKSMALIMTIAVFANLIFTADFQIADNMEVFQEAIVTGYTNSRKWLFGHRNMIFIHHLMWIAFSYVYYALEHRNFKKMFLFQILFTMFVGVVSWNSTMMLVTISVFTLFVFRNSLFSNFSAYHYFLLYAILEIGIVFFRIQNIFSYIIVQILHRNLSFSGRTGIWDYYIKQFVRGDFFHKLFGNLGVTNLSVNSHNMFLGLLAFTGIIGVAFYFFLMVQAIRKLYREKKTDSAKIVSIILFGFLINSLTMEFYLQPISAAYLGYRIAEINKMIERQEGKFG